MPRLYQSCSAKEEEGFSSNNVMNGARNQLSTTHPCANTEGVTGRTGKRLTAQFIGNTVGGCGKEWKTEHSVCEIRNSHDTNHEEITYSGM
jgi:hypothetical protein